MFESEAPVEVSFYNKIGQVSNPKNYNLYDIYEGIINGAWRNRIEQYQSLPQETDAQKTFAKLFKNESFNFTGSGTFDTLREDSLITNHSGFIFIDFDAIKVNKKGKRTGCIEDGKVDEVKSLLCADPYTSCCFKSFSGKGVCVVVKIDPAKHRESFAALSAYYLNKFGFPIDPSCANPSRARFVSYDPELFYNPIAHRFTIGRDYVEFVKSVTEKMLVGAGRGEVHHTLIKASRLMGGYIAGNLIDENEGVEHLISIMEHKEGVVSIQIERKKILDGIANGKLSPIRAEQLREAEVVNEKKDEVIREIYGYVHAMNRAGRKYTDADVVLIAEKYCQEVSLSKDDVKRIFRRVFNENKDEFGIEDAPDIKKVEVYLSKRYEFMRNEVTQLTMYKPIGKHDTIGFDEGKWWDINEDSIFRELQHIGFNFPMQKLTSLLKSDYVRAVNPFKEYFESLPKWDYETDYIGQLADHIQVDDHEFFKIQFRKMLARAVGCACYGQENRTVFVFVQRAEETGKSSFIRFLNPFGDDYYTEAAIRDHKDSAFAFTENFIYNIEELDELSKYDISKLKAIISSNTIKERKPYARNATKQKRRCSFFASTNKDEFLAEDINSRWLCFNVQAINWAYRNEVDIHKVWAEAHALWLDPNFDSQLTVDEKHTRFLKNREYQINTLEKELIKRLFKVCEPIEGEFMSNADILQALNTHWSGRGVLNSRSIGFAMSQLGFERGAKTMNGFTVRGYFVDKNTAEFQFLGENEETEWQKNENLRKEKAEFRQSEAEKHEKIREIRKSAKLF